MKKILPLLFSLLLILPCRAADRLPADSFSRPCTAALLMERETGTVLYGKNEHEHLSPASVTKVMTMLLVCEAVDSGAVTLQDTVTASARAASMGGSQIWLEEGERMSVGDMLKCVAVVSANDCAVALAEHLCGSEEAFTARMNRRAEELGLADTHFSNCTGLPCSGEHYTCAYDIAVMSRELLGHDCIRPYAALWTDTIRDGAFGLTNTNKLVRRYEGCTGLKTGFTSEAMFCLAASARRDGTEYIAVILHGDSSDDRFASARTLLDYAFANYALVSLQPPEALPPVAVEMGEADAVQSVCAAGSALLEKGRGGELRWETELPESVRAPVEAGQELGTMTVSAGGEIVARLPLTAAQSVARRSPLSLYRELLSRLVGGG